MLPTHYDSAEMQEPATVAINSLAIRESPRLAGVNLDHVRTLAECVEELPPIIVHRPTMQVIDGAHRLYAAQMSGRQTIDVRFFDGDEVAAFVVAVQSNVRHGMPLSLSDRTAAAARIIRSHHEWSDRRIASIVGLSPKTVGAIRARSSEEIPQSDVRIGRDGRRRRTDHSAKNNVVRNSIPANSLESNADGQTRRSRGLRTDAELGSDALEAQPRHPLKEARPSNAHTGKPLPRPDRWVQFSTEVVSRLRRDPSLRLTEGGRLLLRLLDLCSVDQRRRVQVLQSIPAHHRDTIMALASDCAIWWRTFAEQLRQQEDSDPPNEQAPA